MQLQPCGYQDEAEQQNLQWIQNRLKELRAVWIIVVDGEVIAYGPSLHTYPDDKEFLAICQRTGKYPFVFFDPLVFAIEERPVAWHNTNLVDDAYPTISVTFLGPTGAIQMEADFDTGDCDAYVDLDLLLRREVVDLSPMDSERTA